MPSLPPLTDSTPLLRPHLPLLAQGKVRDVYTLDDRTLLFVATDRISAYDVVLSNAIPSKGAILTSLSAFWFSFFARTNPSLKTHFISVQLPSSLSRLLDEESMEVMRARAMQVEKLKILKLESIVRGYVTGSAWKEYQERGTVHGIRVREGMRESEAFDAPLWTPSTKAEQGEHDENISPEQAAQIVGADIAKKVERLSLELYTRARDYAAERGIIIADTKFEFGVDEEGEVVLCDEVLTPDSSRFWPQQGYEVGKGQESFDKQYLRDWLTREGLKGKEGVQMPEDVAKETARRYGEAYEKITGTKWSEQLE